MSKYTSTSTRTSLLKDNSWIKRPDEEDEIVDRDPNFGRSVLSGRHKTTETVISTDQSQTKSTTRTSSSSVSALTKKFTTSQDELNTVTSPTRTSYTRNTFSSVSSPQRTITVTEQPKTSTTTTTVTENGKTTETTITTTQKSSTKTDSFMERVFSDRTKGSTYTSYSPKTTVTETTITTHKDTEDKLFDTLLSDPIKDKTDSKTKISKSETVIVKSQSDTPENKLYDTLIPSSIKDQSKTITTETVTTINSIDPDDAYSTTPTAILSAAEDQLYDTLLPKAISNPSTPTSSSITKRETYTVSSSGNDSITPSTRTSSYSSYTDEYPSTRTSTYTISSKTSDDISGDTKTYSYTKPDSSYEYTSITSPSSYTSTTYKTTRTDDILGDTFSRSSVKSVYTTPERTVISKDMCTYCRNPFTGDAKFILDDMKINCHAHCFKCEDCGNTLGHLKAGDSMWIYKQRVNCERCFEATRDKWRR